MVSQYLHAVEDPSNREMATQVIQKWTELKNDFAQLPDGKISFSLCCQIVHRGCDFEQQNTTSCNCASWFSGELSCHLPCEGNSALDMQIPIAITVFWYLMGVIFKMFQLLLQVSTCLFLLVCNIENTYVLVTIITYQANVLQTLS